MSRITRLFANYDSAMGAARELKAQGFAGDQIGLLAKPPTTGPAEPAPTGAELVATIKSVGLPDAQARQYADRVLNGEALLTVWAPYGRTGQATTIMDSFNPIDGGVPHGEATASRQDEGWKLTDEPAPLSRLLHIPVLIKD
jgi:hypothetical protein